MDEDHFLIQNLRFEWEELHDAIIFFALPFVELETRKGSMISGAGEIDVDGWEAPFAVDIRVRNAGFTLHLCQNQVDAIRRIEERPEWFCLVIEASENVPVCGVHHWVQGASGVVNQDRIFLHQAEAQAESAASVQRMVAEALRQAPQE